MDEFHKKLELLNKSKVIKENTDDRAKLLNDIAIKLLTCRDDLGYKLIEGLFDSKSENVYKIIALSKNPEKWEPYRAPGYLKDSGSVALVWWFDDELTIQNMNGEMVYRPNEDEGQEANIEFYTVFDSIDEILDMIRNIDTKDLQGISEILDQIISGNSGDWDKAIRI